MLETEYLRTIALLQDGDRMNTGVFPLAMCPLDLNRALAMLDAHNDNAARQLMHYILLSRAERAFLEF